MVRTEGRRVDKGLTARVAVATEVAEVGVKEVAGAAKEAVAGAAKGLAGKGGLVLGSVLSRVQAGLKTAVEETTRGVKVLATNVERGLGGMGAGMVDGADPDRLAVLQGARRGRRQPGSGTGVLKQRKVVMFIVVFFASWAQSDITAVPREVRAKSCCCWTVAVHKRRRTVWRQPLLSLSPLLIVPCPRNPPPHHHTAPHPRSHPPVHPALRGLVRLAARPGRRILPHRAGGRRHAGATAQAQGRRWGGGRGSDGRGRGRR